MPKHDLYLDLAKTISKYSTCQKLNVGCVLVKDDRILSLGYNGAIRGADQCDEVGCDFVQVAGYLSCKRAVHAELNAILNAAYVGGTATKGSTLYCTHSPCYECAKLLINAGVEEICFTWLYSDPKTWDIWGPWHVAAVGRTWARARVRT